MKLAVGSTNTIKLAAVEEAIADYPLLAEAQVISCAAPSGVADQPTSLEEIVQGAKNRAKQAFDTVEDCSYGIGLESGLFPAPGVQTSFLEACICCIYDGTRHHIGISSGFEVPPHILDLVLHENLDLTQACYRSGITTNPKLGAAEGLIGILSKGRLTRKEYTKQCLITALIQLECHHLYAQPQGVYPLQPTSEQEPSHPPAQA